MIIPKWIEKLMTGKNYILVFSSSFDISRAGESLQRV